MSLLSVLEQFSSPLLLSMFCFIITLILFFIRSMRSSKLKLPPSPPKLPIIGNLHQIGALPYRSFQSLSEKYGPIFLLHLGQTPTLVVSSPEMASEIFKTHDLAFADRPQVLASRILLYACTNVGFGAYDSENWRQKKKICVNELLRVKRVQSFKHIREEEAGELVNNIRNVSLSGENGVCVNLTNLMLETTNDIVCKIVSGDEISRDQRATFNELARRMMIYRSAFSVGDCIPSLGWVDVLTGLIPNLKTLSKDVDDFLDQVIQHHKSRSTIMHNDDQSSNTTQSIVDVVLQFQHDYGFTHDDIKSILLDLLVGGTETNAATMEWVMVELMRHPMKMKKAQKEIRRVVGRKSKIDESDIEKMSYLKCVIKEVMRLHPPTPLVAPRIARSNVEVNGYSIPAKTVVYVNAWAIQRDPKCWERPEDFLPERFEKNDVNMNDHDFRIVMFGSGRRGCPGIMFALMLIECVVANLLYWFDWKLPKDVEELDISEVYGVTTTRTTPLYLQPIPYSFES